MSCVSANFTMLFLIVAAILLSTIVEARGTYLYQSSIGGSLRRHKLTLSWDEAYQQCRSEGAVLASPNTAGLHKELRTLFNNTFYFIGVDARLYYNTFVSVEGVALDEMPVTDMYESLDLDDGECLSMNQHEIRVVQCTSRMPYVCYKNESDQANVTTYCNTDGYTYYESTRSRYKMHRQRKSYDDAAATCATEHAHLLVIDDEKEAQTIKQMNLTDNRYTYVGLRNMDSDGYNWISATNKRLTDIYHVWYSGRPTCSYPGHCPCAILLHTLMFDDQNCNEVREFICER